MRTDLFRGVFKWGASLTTIIILSLPAIAQARDDHAFDVVPLQHRGSLVQSILEFVECEKAAQYGRLYELLDDQEASGINKENYIAARVKDQTKRCSLPEFAPLWAIDLTLNDGDPITYQVAGKAWVKVGNDVVEKEMTTTAKLHSGFWKFLELSDSTLHVEKRR